MLNSSPNRFLGTRIGNVMSFKKRLLAASCCWATMVCSVSVYGQEPSAAPNEVLGPSAAPTLPPELLNLFGVPEDSSHQWISAWLAKNKDWTVAIDRFTVTLHGFNVGGTGEVQIPRMMAAIQSMAATLDNESCELTITPDPKIWKLRWKNTQPIEDRNHEVDIKLVLNDRPIGITQSSATYQQADGTIVLRAQNGITSGELLRFEPQPFKNTIGYWANPKDTVSWEFQVNQPGQFAVAVLAGCGAGQGGSVVELRAGIDADNHNETASLEPSSKSMKIEFAMIETGHFQNFRWQPIGMLTIEKADKYKLTLTAKSLANKAIGDVRMISLVRQSSPQ